VVQLPNLALEQLSSCFPPASCSAQQLGLKSGGHLEPHSRILLGDSRQVCLAGCKAVDVFAAPVSAPAPLDRSGRRAKICLRVVGEQTMAWSCGRF
jgi:hypothetical protein